jgi:hypothetical protein
VVPWPAGGRARAKGKQPRSGDRNESNQEDEVVIPTPRPPIEISPVFDDPARVHALFERYAPYPMLQSRGQVMKSGLENAVIGGEPISDELVRAAERNANATLNLSPTFRGYWATPDQVVEGAEWIFRYEPFLAGARALHGGNAVVRPNEIYAHLIVPHRQRNPGSHVDLPSFRGLGRRELPGWLLAIMRRSGLFERWRIPVATAVCWFYRGAGGTYTCWPDGAQSKPRTTRAPFDNTGLMGENDTMFHRGDPVGSGELESPPGLSLESTLAPSSEDPDWWEVRNGNQAIARYPRQGVRFALSWSAEVFEDEDAARRADAAEDALDLDTAIAVLRADLKRRGVSHSEPGDPRSDPQWIATLARAYPLTPRLEP